MEINSPYLHMLQDRINLHLIPFTDCGSRILVYQNDGALSIHLAESGLSPDNRSSLNSDRPALIEQLSFTDAKGQPVALKVTTYPHCLECHTPVGDFLITFQDSESLLVVPPPGAWGIRFRTRAERARSDDLGGILHLNSSINHDIIYTTNARVQANQVSPRTDGTQEITLQAKSEPGQSLLLNITQHRRPGRYLPDPTEALQAAEQRWHKWFTAAPIVNAPLQRQYYYAWWALRAGITSTRAFVGDKPLESGKFQYLGISRWDVYFLALAYRHMDVQLAQNQLRNLLACQWPDGSLGPDCADEMWAGAPELGGAVRPPMAAWTAWKLYKTSRDSEFLDEIYASLVHSNRWWFDYHDQDRNGLCEYPPALATEFNSSPLWQTGQPVEAPDLNTYIYLQQEALARIAAVIDRPEESQNWARRAEKTNRRMLDTLWDGQAGMFWAHQQGQPIQVRTPFSLFPLLTGRMPQPVAAHMVANLTDPQQFWTRYPVPSIAYNDPCFDPDQKWRGDTWISINYLLIEGLKRSGLHGLSRELRHRTLEMVYTRPDIFDSYHPLTGESVPSSTPVFPWSSAIFVDLAIQDEYDRQRTRSNSISPYMRRVAV